MTASQNSWLCIPPEIAARRQRIAPEEHRFPPVHNASPSTHMSSSLSHLRLCFLAPHAPPPTTLRIFISNQQLSLLTIPSRHLPSHFDHIQRALQSGDIVEHVVNFFQATICRLWVEVVYRGDDEGIDDGEDCVRMLAGVRKHRRRDICASGRRWEGRTCIGVVSDVGESHGRHHHDHELIRLLALAERTSTRFSH